MYEVWRVDDEVELKLLDRCGWFKSPGVSTRVICWTTFYDWAGNQFYTGAVKLEVLAADEFRPVVWLRGRLCGWLKVWWGLWVELIVKLTRDCCAGRLWVVWFVLDYDWWLVPVGWWFWIGCSLFSRHGLFSSHCSQHVFYHRNLREFLFQCLELKFQEFLLHLLELLFQLFDFFFHSFHPFHLVLTIGLKQGSNTNCCSLRLKFLN